MHEGSPKATGSIKSFKSVESGYVPEAWRPSTRVGFRFIFSYLFLVGLSFASEMIAFASYDLQSKVKWPPPIWPPWTDQAINFTGCVQWVARHIFRLHKPVQFLVGYGNLPQPALGLRRGLDTPTASASALRLPQFLAPDRLMHDRFAGAPRQPEGDLSRVGSSGNHKVMFKLPSTPVVGEVNARINLLEPNASVVRHIRMPTRRVIPNKIVGSRNLQLLRDGRRIGISAHQLHSHYGRRLMFGVAVAAWFSQHKQGLAWSQQEHIPGPAREETRLLVGLALVLLKRQRQLSILLGDLGLNPESLASGGRRIRPINPNLRCSECIEQDQTGDNETNTHGTAGKTTRHHR
jgi:hypothetical protein